MRPKVVDNGDGTYTVTYTPEELGQYQVKIKFGGQEVPNSPFVVNTVPTGDASKVRIEGQYTGNFLLTHRIKNNFESYH